MGFPIVSVSNPTPVPGEDIVIEAKGFDAYEWYAFADHKIVALLVIDEAEVARTDVHIWRIDYGEYRGDFSFTIRAPYVPGPYTYWVEFYSKRWGYLMDRSAPVGIEVLPEFVCPWCGATFPSEGLLEAHKATCPYRPEYACPWCGAVFATEEELEAHKLVCPQRPPPVPLERILLFGSIGLVGVGLVWMAGES